MGLLLNYFNECIKENIKIKMLLATDLEVDDQLAIHYLLNACLRFIIDTNYNNDVELAILVGESDPDIQIFRIHKLLDLIKEKAIFPDNLKINILRGFESHKKFEMAGFEFIDDLKLIEKNNIDKLLNSVDLSEIERFIIKKHLSKLAAESKIQGDSGLKTGGVYESEHSDYTKILEHNLDESVDFSQRSNELRQKVSLELESYFQDKVLFICIKPPREILSLIKNNPTLFNKSEYVGTFGFNIRTIIEESQEIAKTHAKTSELTPVDTNELINQATRNSINEIMAMFNGFSKVSFFESGPSLGGEYDKLSCKTITVKDNPEIYEALAETGKFGKVILNLINNWNLEIVKSDLEIIINFAYRKNLPENTIDQIRQLLNDKNFTEEIYNKIFQEILPSWNQSANNTEEDKKIAYALERKKNKLLSITKSMDQAIIVDYIFIIAISSKDDLFDHHEVYLTFNGTKSELSINKPDTPYVMVSAYLPKKLSLLDYLSFSKLYPSIKKESSMLGNFFNQNTDNMINQVYQCYHENKKNIENSLIIALKQDQSAIVQKTQK